MRVELSRELLTLFDGIAKDSAEEFGVDTGRMYDSLTKLAFLVKGIELRVESSNTKKPFKLSQQDYDRGYSVVKTLTGDYAKMSGHLLQALQQECLPNWKDRKK